MQLIDAILLLDEQQLVAHVAYNGEVREVVYRWYEKEPGNLPPKKWSESVRGEIEFVRGEEGRVARGGIPKHFGG